MASSLSRCSVMSAVARVGEGVAHTISDTEPRGLEALWQDLPQPWIEFQRKPLWDRPIFLGLLLGLLVLEWSLRCWKGLA